VKSADSRRGSGTKPAADLAKDTSASAAPAHQLHELIAALDRRVPHVERAGEEAIARDAAALRAKAVTRLAELEQKIQSGRPLRRR
jgi:hypothetical protein